MEHSNLIPSTVSPKNQETFRSTEWKEGNTGKTKNHNFNNDFTMKYRTVHTSQRLLDTISASVQNSLETRIDTRGQEQPMGIPYTDFGRTQESLKEPLRCFL